jgi:hypothetical protein
MGELTLGQVRGELQVDLSRLRANWVLAQGYDQALVVNLGFTEDLKLLVDSGQYYLGQQY